MKVKTTLTTILTILFIIGLVAGSSIADVKGYGKSRSFVDANGDGINDNAIDSDGDGIPNGKDPDYVPAGQAKKTRTKKGQSVNANDTNSANLAPLADRIRDRLQDGSCDGTGFKKSRSRGK